MPPVRSSRRDWAAGLAVLVCVEGFLWMLRGWPGMFIFGWACSAALVFLWHRGGPFGKILATVLDLSILLRLLLPKHLRDAVNALPSVAKPEVAPASVIDPE
jgi:hypothetical protein